MRVWTPRRGVGADRAVRVESGGAGTEMVAVCEHGVAQDDAHGGDGALLSEGFFNGAVE